MNQTHSVEMEVEGIASIEECSGIIDAPNFDLEAYISRYDGITKIQRLQFIAKRCAAARNEAYRAAIDELKRGLNTELYREIMNQVGDSLGPGYRCDEDWIQQIDKKCQANQDKLELELNQFKTNLIKESIRMGFHELGQHHLARGNLPLAFKNFVRTRDYCGTGRHSAEMCLAVITVAAAMGNWAHVNNYVVKAEHTAEVSTLPEVSGKLNAAGGLVQLRNKHYKQAAIKFLDVDPAMGGSFSEVLAPEDVAVYGGLCALATFERHELKTRVLDNTRMKDFLDLVPQVRELINDVFHSRYASCLLRLKEMRNDYIDLDIHLHEHVDTLYQKIRDNCLCQYFSPFLTVSLSSITEAFGMEEVDLRKELARLIVSGRIKARIDTQAGALRLNQADERRLCYKKAFEMGISYQQEARSLLLRLSCLKNDFSIRNSRGGRGHVNYSHPESSGGYGANSQEPGMAMSEPAEELM